MQCFLTSNSENTGWWINPAPEDTSGFEDIFSLGAWGICARGEEINPTCWGYGFNGDVDFPAINPDVLGSGVDTVCFYQSSDLACFHNGFGGPYGVGNPPDVLDVSSIDGGHHHTCAIASSNIICWGRNDEWLGLLTVPEVESPSQLALRDFSSCVLHAYGVSCWGGTNSYLENQVPQLPFDPDGDGYSSQDGQDAFPLDASEWADFDLDGVGDNTDNCPVDSNATQVDTDGDELGDVCDPFPTDPDNDSDGDGIVGETDNCPQTSNADQLDTDSDGLGDVCDPDDDGDGVPDSVDEYPLISLSGRIDTDGDGRPDECDLSCQLEGMAADSDDDNDGLTDDQELSLGTNPLLKDTDGDGWPDKEEVDEGTDPLLASSQPELSSGLPIWLLYQATQ